MTAKKTTAKAQAVKAIAPRQRVTRTGTSGVSRIDQLGLSKLFRPGSTTRKAAELLLGGEPISKAEIMRRTGVVETVVPRTITSLRNAGVEIERTQDKTTKQATYRALIPVIDHAPPGSFEFFAREDAEATVKMVSMEAKVSPARRGAPAEGAVVTVVLDSPLGQVSGSAPMSPHLAALADGLPLARVILLPGGRQEWMLGHLPTTILVSDITYV